MSPRVTVVTATWGRPKTLFAHAVESINRQTYENIEHLVVIDGHDPELSSALEKAGYQADTPSDRRYTFLGRNWTSYADNGSIGATARLVGSWMGTGELITYLDDDNDYDPEHIEQVVSLFESDPDLGFVISALKHWPLGFPVQPAVGYADTSGITHRAMLLRDHGGLRPDGGTDDGNMVERWAAAGVKWHAKWPATVSFNGKNNGRPEWL